MKLFALLGVVAVTAHGLTLQNVPRDDPHIPPGSPEPYASPLLRWKGCCSYFMYKPFGKGSCLHWIKGCDRDQYGPFEESARC